MPSIVKWQALISHQRLTVAYPWTQMSIYQDSIKVVCPQQKYS